MNIKNCRAIEVDIQSDISRDGRYPYHKGVRFTENSPPRVAVTLLLPIRPEDLPAFLAERRINIEIEATPGESAYIAWAATERPRSVCSAREWLDLEPSERDRWEKIAIEAKRAH